MDRTYVTSSLIQSIGYDANSQTLEIEFVKGGVYQYSGVSEDEYAGLMGSESHGKHFLANIRDKYPFTRC